MITHLDQLEEIDIHFPEALFKQRLVSWYQKNRRLLPWRVRWEASRDPYEIWVSEIMLQQTVIKAVIPAYQRFLETFPSLRDLAAASEDQVRLASRGLGYYRRFRMLREAAEQLVAQPQLQWPTSFKEWKTLPGVGDYTAAAIASICFDDPTPVVDGNVERLFCRLWDIRLAPNLPKLKKCFFQLGQTLMDPQHPGDFNQGLMELGQTICTKQNPSCDLCPLQEFCMSRAAASQSLAPQPKEKITYQQVQLGLLIPHQRGRFGILKRPHNAKFLKETWGFPTIFLDANQFRWDGVSPQFPLRLKETQPLGKISHSITKHKISARVFLTDKIESKHIRWLDRDEMEENLVSNLDRKAWACQEKILSYSL